MVKNPMKYVFQPFLPKINNVVSLAISVTMRNLAQNTTIRCNNERQASGH